MHAHDFKVGDKVVFGRRHGEQTEGTVVKVNAQSIKVRQDEERGMYRTRPAGVVWRVAPSLCRHANGAASAPARVPAPVQPPARPKRSEAEIMASILDAYVGLSPENLSCDGEAPVAWVRKRAAALRAQLRRDFQDLGREVGEDEAYRHAYPRAFGAAR